MAEPSEPRRPRKGKPTPPTPPTPLPRMWRAEPEPAPEPAAPRKKKRDEPVDEPTPSKKKGKGKAAIKLEETPVLDTYEARTRVRYAVGFGIVGVIALVVFALVRNARGPSTNEVEVAGETESVEVRPAGANPGRVEVEAANMLGQARLVARKGRTDQAISLLEKIVVAYPGSPSAKAAQAALARPSKNLPLFLDGPAVAAEGVETPEPTAPMAPMPVDAVAATPGGARTADANLTLPVNPAEPGRSTATDAPASPGDARALPPGFRARPEAGTHESGWPLQIVGDRDGATLVLVPGGTFIRGRDDGPPAEQPAHRVTLATYYIDQHEVTVRHYAIFKRETGRPDPPKARPTDPSEPPPGPETPVVNVTARDAKAYADWSGKRLPTEAQWEAAARTPDGRPYPSGPEPPAWSKPRVPRQIDPAMSFPSDQSPYGVFDLAGNASEWTGDWFDAKHYQQFREAVADNPTGPPSSRAKPPMVTIKGGSKEWRASWRDGMRVEARLPHLGFRCVLNVESAPRSAAPTAAPAAGTQPEGVIPF